jgi:hypothetical protein
MQIRILTFNLMRIQIQDPTTRIFPDLNPPLLQNDPLRLPPYTLLRIRILLLTLMQMWIRIQLFTLTRMWIGIQLFTLMRIRIQLPKMCGSGSATLLFNISPICCSNMIEKQAITYHFGFKSMETYFLEAAYRSSGKSRKIVPNRSCFPFSITGYHH